MYIRIARNRVEKKSKKKRSKRNKNNRSKLVRDVQRRTDLRKKYFGTGVVCLAWFRNREFAITVHEVASGQSRWAEGRSRIISCGSRHRWLNREKSFIKATADENRIAESERARACARVRERERGDYCARACARAPLVDSKRRLVTIYRRWNERGSFYRPRGTGDRSSNE